MDDIEIFMRSASSGLLLYVLAPSVRLKGVVVPNNPYGKTYKTKSLGGKRKVKIV